MPKQTQSPSRFVGMQNQARKTTSSTLKVSGLAVSLLLAALVMPSHKAALAQTATPELSPAATVETAAKVVRWTGTLPEQAGKTVEVQFGIYENAAGGMALWTESQRVTVGSDGRYSVLLGATSNEGLPQTLFPAGVGRWVAAHPISNAKPEAEIRSLLAAVPYAFKAVDAETLAGRSAADYVTREDLKAATAAVPALAAPATTQVIQPNLAGTGSPNYLPIWTNSTTLGNSTIYEISSKVGIGITAPSTTLDVNGTTTLRGTTVLPAINTSSTSAGYGSRILQFGANSWSSSSSVNVPQTFQLEALPVGNNTANPSANISLLYGVGTAAPKATGLSFGANGLITFAAGQKFPGTGAINTVTASSPLTGGGSTSSITLGLNVATLETTLNGKYPQLAAANNFTSTNSFAGEIIGNSTGTAYSILGNTASGVGVGGISTGAGAQGVHGYSSGAGSFGVYGNSVGAVNGSNAPIGVLGHSTYGFGVKGLTDAARNNYAAVFGQNGPGSGSLTYIKGFDDISGGVWGDSAASGTTSFPIGVIGTADDSFGGYFLNNGSAATVYAENKGSGTTGLFMTFMAVTPQGTCGFGSGGSMTCTGQIKSLITNATGEHTVETYSVQSPENWMEDFGSGKLQSGSAQVLIDPAFAETISGTTDYHVFLTAKGESKNLYVINESPRGFEVREADGGKTSIAFDYRIVAKRRGLEAQRLTDVTENYRHEMQAATRHMRPAPIQQDN